MENKSEFLSIYLENEIHQKFANFAKKHNESMRNIFISLVENYIYGDLKLSKNKFIESRLTIRLNEEVHEKMKEVFNIKREINYNQNQRKRTFQSVGEKLIDKYILNNLQVEELNNFSKKLKKYQMDKYNGDLPKKNKSIKIKINLEGKNKLQSILEKNNLNINSYQKLIEPLFYAYAYGDIVLKDKLFERKQLKVKVTPELYKAFEDKREFQGKNRTIQKVGELIIDQKLMKNN